MGLIRVKSTGARTVPSGAPTRLGAVCGASKRQDTRANGTVGPGCNHLRSLRDTGGFGASRTPFKRLGFFPVPKHAR